MTGLTVVAFYWAINRGHMTTEFHTKMEANLADRTSICMLKQDSMILLIFGMFLTHWQSGETPNIIRIALHVFHSNGLGVHNEFVCCSGLSSQEEGQGGPSTLDQRGDGGANRFICK